MEHETFYRVPYRKKAILPNKLTFSLPPSFEQNKVSCTSSGKKKEDL